MATFAGKLDDYGRPIVYADDEDLGRLETRWLTHPDGHKIKVRQRRLVWEWIDYLNQYRKFSLPSLLALTERLRVDVDVPFDEALRETTAMVLDSYSRIGGLKD